MRWLAWVFLFAFRIVATFLLSLLGFLLALLATTLFIGAVFFAHSSDIERRQQGLIEQNAIALAPGEFERLREGPLIPNYERGRESDDYYQIFYRNELYPSYFFYRREGQDYVSLLPYGFNYPCPVVVTLGWFCTGTTALYNKDYGLMLIDNRPLVYSLAEGLQHDSEARVTADVYGWTGWSVVVSLALLAAVIWATRRLFPRRVHNQPSHAARIGQRLGLWRRKSS